MPNIKSAIKRVKVSRAKTLRNVVKKSALRSTIRKCKESISKNDPTATTALQNAIKAIDKAAARNLMHKNTAARKKSRLTKALNAAANK